MSAQGKERIDHVWMKVLDQKNEGVGKTELNESWRDETGIGGEEEKSVKEGRDKHTDTQPSFNR